MSARVGVLMCVRCVGCVGFHFGDGWLVEVVRPMVRVDAVGFACNGGTPKASRGGHPALRRTSDPF